MSNDGTTLVFRVTFPLTEEEEKEEEMPTFIAKANSHDQLQVWVAHGALHLRGLTAGQRWSVYSLSGSLVYQSIAESDEASVPLSLPFYLNSPLSLSSAFTSTALGQATFIR